MFRTPLVFIPYLAPIFLIVANVVVLVFLFAAQRRAPHGGLVALICAALLEICVSAAGMAVNFALLGFGGHRLPTELTWWYVCNLLVVVGRCGVIALSAVGIILLAQAFARLATGERKG